MPGLEPPRLPYALARRRGVMLLADGESAIAALREGADPMALIEARRVAGRPLTVERLDAAAWDRRLSEIYADSAMDFGAPDEFAIPEGLDSLIGDMPAAEDLLDSADDAPVIRLINGLIAQAVRAGASDIHIEPYEAALKVRMRVDGVLAEIMSLPPWIIPMLASRIKVMARLDIAERRIPQDGRIPLTLGGRSLDVRVSTLPSGAGERVVMRILDKDQAGVALADLGMDPATLAHFTASLGEPNGVILVTGPTGSGKTTTLYAGLALLNDATRNILTIEDPVEYAVEGVGQTQVNTKVGMTFASGLRAILRQDPDVVMVGEIRDVETAQIAVQASLTGHLVLSTVHTNDAAGAVTRLRDLGVEPFLLASTLRLIMAQRLVRRLCPHCRREEAAGKPLAKLAGLKGKDRVWRPVGCEACGHTGYAGRIGVYEAIRVDEPLRRLIAADASEAEIAELAFSRSDAFMARARAMVLEGVTSLEEALRVIRQDAASDPEDGRS